MMIKNERKITYMRISKLFTAAALLLLATSGLMAAQQSTAAVPGVPVQPVSYFYTGKPYDADLGAYTFNHRNYNPEIKRWTSADPSGFPDGANNYILVNNSVLICFDPDGFASITVYANPAGSTANGDGGSSGSITNQGHAWVTVTMDDGTTTTQGNYPDGRRDDSNRNPDSKTTFEVSDEAAQAAMDAINNTNDYGLLTDNCVDMVERVLDAAEIDHPDFGSPSDPSNVNTWVLSKE